MESADHAGAKALVEDLLAIAGIDAVGGRTAGEIADRFLEQAALRSGEPIEAEKRKALEAFLAISGDPDEAATKLRRARRRRPARPRPGARCVRTAQRLHRRPRRRDRRDPLQRRLRARLRLLHRLRLRGARSRAARRAGRRSAAGATMGSRKRLGASGRHSRRRRGDRDRPARRRGRALMAFDARERRPKPPFVLAVPSKGRLQESAAAFFARAGLELVQGRGARDYRGALAGLPGVEVAFVSSRRDRRPARRRRGAFRRRRRGSGAREGSGRRGASSSS